MKKAVIGVVFQEIIITFSYLIVLELDTYPIIFMTYIKTLILLQTYIGFKIQIVIFVGYSQFYFVYIKLTLKINS